MRQETSYGIIPVKQKKGKWIFLLIRHEAGHWAFPKGHPEPGESPSQAAQRELQEETGLVVKKILNQEPFREHYRFTHEGELINKEVIYYLAEVEGEVVLQLDELTDHRWVEGEDAENWLTYSEAKRICRAASNFLTS